MIRPAASTPLQRLEPDASGDQIEGDVVAQEHLEPEDREGVGVLRDTAQWHWPAEHCVDPGHCALVRQPATQLPEVQIKPAPSLPGLH